MGWVFGIFIVLLFVILLSSSLFSRRVNVLGLGVWFIVFFWVR